MPSTKPVLQSRTDKATADMPFLINHKFLIKKRAKTAEILAIIHSPAKGAVK